MRGLLNVLVRDRFLPSVKSLGLAFIYDGSPAHQQALALYEFLLQEVDESSHLNASWWRTGLLSNPKLARIAARALGRSDMIVLSFDEEEEPSPQLRTWIETWPVASRTRARLLVLLQGLDEQEASSSPWNIYLRDFAVRKNLFYLPGPLLGLDDAPSDGLTSVTEASEEEPVRAPNRLVEPYLHWGLNE